MDRHDIEDIYELSPAQQGMFFHTLLGKDQEILVEQIHCAFDASLDPDVLRQACAHVVERHTALRTSFHLADLDKPLQVVHRSVALPWQPLDWSHLPDHAIAGKLETLLAEDRARGFDPEAAPLMRFFLIRLPGHRYRFVWSHHHLLFDGWSLPVVMRELLASYEAFSRGQRPHLEPSRPYKEYIAYLDGRRRADAEAFWQSHLGDVSEPTPVGSPIGTPASAGAPAGQGTIREQTVTLPAGVPAGLATLARQHRVTTSATFQAAWALLLGTWSQRDDVLFGMTVSGRPPELDQVASCVGLFINTLPVRVAMRPERTVADLLRQIQADNLERHEHEHTPLVEIQEWSGVPRGRSLFDSLLVFENFPHDLSMGSLAVDDVQILGGKTHYAITLIVDPEGELSFRFLHRSDAVSEEVAAALCQGMRALLQAMARDPESTVAALQAAVPPLPRPAPRPEEAPGARAPTHAAPRTPVEETLWAIWCELLGTRQVGIHDDFFALGGHSLLATQVISRVRQTFGADIPLKVLFTSGHTIAELAGTIDEYLIDKAGDEELAEMYAELEQLSEEEAERMLLEEGGAQ